MINNKVITIVLPAYNAEKTLEQTYREIPFDIVFWLMTIVPIIQYRKLNALEFIISSDMKKMKDTGEIRKPATTRLLS